MNVNDPSSAQQLFEKLNKFDDAAFDKVYKHYRPLLTAHVNRTLQNPDKSQDVVQEVFANILDARGSMDTSIPLRGYLLSAVNNYLVNLFAREGVEARYIAHLTHFATNYDYAYSADQSILYKELEAFIEEEVAALPPKMRRIYEYSRKGYMSHKEIATQVNVKESTVAIQITNALNRLRSKLYCAFFLNLMVALLLVNRFFR